MLSIAAVGIYVYFDRGNGGDNVVGELSQDRRGGIFGFLGFGDSSSNNSTQDGAPTGNQNPGDTQRSTFVPTLRQLTQEPVAGFTFTGTSTVRYVDRGTGHTLEADLTSYDVQKLSNTTIPKVYRAFWVNKGEGVVYQQLSEQTDTIKTSFIELINTTGTSTEALKDTVITFLEDNISEIAVSPDTDKIVYLKNGLITIGGPDGAGQSSFKIPGNEWILEWTSPNKLNLTTKASALVDGYSYTSSLAGSMTKLIGPASGLTTYNPDNNWFLWSESDGNTVTLFAENPSTGTTTPMIPGALPEKCVLLQNKTDSVVCGVSNFIQNQQYMHPDSWYQSVVSFEDRFSLYNLSNPSSKVLIEPQTPVDVIEPMVGPEDIYLVFINKKDLTLWSLNLEEALVGSGATAF